MALHESANKAKTKTTDDTNCSPSCLLKDKCSKASENTCNVVTKSEMNSSADYSMESLFQGKLVHQTKCLNCEESKLRYEDFQDVSVPVVEDQPYLDARKKLMLSPTPKKNKDNVHTLQWAMSQFASSECLQGDNKYFCENCNTFCEAEISTCFDKLPIILTVHLKRLTSSVG
jgi:ubiquitin C-terminal hydrolase